MTERLRIAFLDTNSRNVNHYIYLGIAQALRRHPHVDDVVEVDYGNALALARERRANLFLAYDGQGLNTEICRRLRQRCGFAVLWLTDDPYELRYNLQSSDVFDLIFSNDRDAARAYGAKGHYLPFGADPQVYHMPVRAEGDAGLRYDVFFAGVAWPNRVRILRSFMRDLPDVRFKVALVGNRYLPEFRLPTATSAYAFRTAPRDFARLANASRLTLGLTRDFAESSNAISRSASPPPRFFEAAIAGTLQLVDESAFDVAMSFVPGTEIATFATYHECLDSIRSYLADPAKRFAIAEASQRRALRDHTFDARVAALLKTSETANRGDLVRPLPVRKRRPRVLFVAHNTLGASPGGGIEAYLDQLRRWIGQDYEAYTFSFSRTEGENSFVLLDARGETIDRVAFDGAWQRFSLTNDLKEAYFSDLLARYEIDLVHFHHLIGHPLSLPIVARALGIPSVWTLHDYDGVCDSFNLLDSERRYCDIVNRPEGVCDYCTQRRVGLDGSAQEARRFVMRKALESVDRILVSSASTVTTYARFYFEALAGARTVVLPIPASDSEPRRFDRSDGPMRFVDGADTALQIVVLGNFTIEKGAEVVLDAASALWNDPVRFVIHGRVDPAIERRMAKMRLPSVDVRGTYGPEDIGSILASADCTLHASIWPETYCLALSEAWTYGRVPIVTDIGALGERVTDRVNGFKIRPNDAADLVRLVREIIESRELIVRAESTIEPSLWPTARAHVTGLKSIYRELLDESGLDVRTGSERIARTRVTFFDCGEVLSPHALAVGHPNNDARNIIFASKRPFARESDGTPSFEPADAELLLSAPARIDAHIDEIDGLSSDVDTIIKREHQTLSVRGWRADRSANKVLRRPHVLLLSASERVAYRAEADSEPRPDVARAFRVPALGDAGFRCTASLAGVAPGTYRILVEDDGRYSVAEGPAIRVSGRAETDDFFAELEPTGALDATIGSINGEAIVVGGEPASANGSLRVRGAHRGPFRNDASLWLVFESIFDGERRYARLPIDLLGRDETPFEIDLDVHEFAPCTYRLSLTSVSNGQRSSTGTLGVVRLGALQ